MSDFMSWLYANYIKPQIKAIPRSDYPFHMDIVRNDIMASGLDSLDRVLEFTAVQAFLLGLRAGEELSRP